jgi:hypothetical protein
MSMIVLRGEANVRLKNKWLLSNWLGSLVSKSSCFLGDPPPDPRFLASLGALSVVPPITPLTENPGPKDLSASHRTSFGPVQLVTKA